jgi:hypothetical protein
MGFQHRTIENGRMRRKYLGPNFAFIDNNLCSANGE